MRKFLAAFAFGLLACFPAHALAQQQIPDPIFGTFTTTGPAAGPALQFQKGYSSCSVVASGTGTGLVAVPQNSSDTGNTWVTNGNIGTGSITANGTYAGGIANVGLTSFRLNVTGQSGGTETWWYACSTSLARAATGGGVTTVASGTNISVTNPTGPTATVNTVASPAFTNVTATGSIAAGSGTAGSFSSGDLNASRTVSTGAILVGGSTLSCFQDFGVDIATGMAVRCPLYSAKTASAAVGPVGPVFLASGSPEVSTYHCVQDTIASAGATTTVTLTAPATFANTLYTVFLLDTTSFGTGVALTAQATGSFTFTSTAAHNYNFIACGP